MRCADDEVFRRDGVVMIEEATTPVWTDVMRRTIDAGFADRSFIWRYGAEFVRLAAASGLADIAMRLLGGPVTLLYDEFLEKRPADTTPTPWHADISYWPIEGNACSIWLALDPVDAGNGGMEYVVGSHAWQRTFKPTSVRDRDAWKNALGEEVPDIEADRARYRIFSRALRAGDAIAHDARTLHAAHGNASSRRRRTYITRWLAADAMHAPKPHAKALPADLRAFEDYPRCYPPS